MYQTVFSADRWGVVLAVCPGFPTQTGGFEPVVLEEFWELQVFIIRSDDYYISF